VRAVLALAALLTLLAAPARGQSHCADRDVVIKQLAAKYGESYAGGGLRGSGAIFEVWRSSEHRTWTIIKTLPNGKSCVMAAGTDWREHLPPIGEKS